MFDAVSKQYLLKDRRTIHTALEKVSFRIDAGESIGLVGGNGSGKSTVLKLIAQITAPSSGTVILNGRVAALLEVGLGFHPELSGRENIVFNGALLGVAPKTIRQQMDQIVEIAGLGDYLEQPLRMYSTGMQARLGFAVACTLSADIIVLDEVLEVGDITFRQRAMALIADLTKQQGRTAIICSHSSEIIANTCDRALWLQDGQIRDSGETANVIKAYEHYEYWEKLQPVECAHETEK